MVEYEFYATLISFVKINKDIIVESSSFDKDDFEELDFIFDDDEFLEFDSNIFQINKIQCDSDNLIEARLILWYLQLSVKYFKYIPFRIYKYLKVLTIVDYDRVVSSKNKYINVPNDIILKICVHLKKLLQVNSIKCSDFNNAIELNLRNIENYCCSKRQINFSKVSEVYEETLKLSYMYSELDIIIDLCSDILDSGRSEDYRLLEEKIASFESK